MRFPSLLVRYVAAAAVLAAAWHGHALAQEPAAGGEDEMEAMPDTAFYREGLRVREALGQEAALDFWDDARGELASRDLHDPRIAFAFMETSLELPDSAWASTAVRIYLWGLTAPLVPGSRPALEEELDRILPLLDGDDRIRMEALRDRSDRELARGLKRFWIEQDPTPTTRENERLQEHWERILEARRRFVYTRRPPLGTDERGVVFLRYGEPDRIVKGSLGASEVELQVRVPRDREARMRIRQYDPKPQYEAWVYDQLTDEGFTYFLFGNVDGTGPFRLVDGVHELIYPPSRSMASARFTPGGIPASYYLELFYYEELSKLGGYWGDRFSELDQLWNRYTYRSNPYRPSRPLSPSEQEVHMLTDRYRQQDEFFPLNQPLRPIFSDFDGRARDELVAQSMRILSDDDEPRLVLVGASAPRLTADRRQAYGGRLELPGWVMRHSLIIRDGDLNEVGRMVQPVDADRADASSFVLRHVPEPIHLTLTAQTFIQDAEADTLLPTDRYPGQAHIVPGEPLDPDPQRFQMSDLLTGTLVPPDLRFADIPYPLLPARRLWIQDPLRVYLELYHMGRASDGRARLDARFRIVPLREDGTEDPDRDPVTLEVELTPPAGRAYRETFDMQLRDQEPGRYRLVVEIVDTVRNQLQRRTAELELAR